MGHMSKKSTAALCAAPPTTLSNGDIAKRDSDIFARRVQSTFQSMHSSLIPLQFSTIILTGFHSESLLQNI